MKQYLRNRVSKTASYVEIVLSILIIIGILVVSVILVKDLVTAIVLEFQGVFSFDFRSFIGMLMQLIIGVEFVKMISKHTPESTVEVLMLVVARKIIIDDPAFVEIALGIVSIGILFVIKQYYTQKTNPEGCILEGSTKLAEMNVILRSKIQDPEAADVSDLVRKEMESQKISIIRGSRVIIQDHIFKVYSMTDGEIDAVEVAPANPRRFHWFWHRNRR
jgi:hypothetical protein